MNEHLIAHVLRRMGVLPLAFQIAFGLNVVRHSWANRKFKQTHPEFAVPPLDLAYEAYTTVSYEHYYRGGLRTANAVYHRLTQYLPEGPLTICDWGCGPGRVVRHLPSIDPNRPVRAFGSDLNRRSIQWCQAHIKNVTFCLNGLEPPLSFDDDQFDALYSFSVYTHLPEALQRTWLQENLRVVRPGGLVLLTFLGDSYKHRLLKPEREQYESVGIVVRGHLNPGAGWFTTYNNPAFVEQEFLKGLEIVYRRVHPEGASQAQDQWLVRKPA